MANSMFAGLHQLQELRLLPYLAPGYWSQPAWLPLLNSLSLVRRIKNRKKKKKHMSYATLSRIGLSDRAKLNPWASFAACAAEASNPRGRPRQGPRGSCCYSPFSPLFLIFSIIPSGSLDCQLSIGR